MKIKVCWISAGVSSFISAYLVKDTIDEFIYIDIADQHPDSIRFIHDCEKVLGKEIKFLRSKTYKNVRECCIANRSISSPGTGAKCSQILKRRVRKQWEIEHQEYDITYVWGFDVEEKNRANRIIDSMPLFSHEFPLIDNNLNKDDAHAICKKLGIKRPIMYDLGYTNNNCIGCVKGGKGYWNKIRIDFPDVFEDRSKMERELQRSIIWDHGKQIYLDELDPNEGRNSPSILEDCSIYCQIAYDNL